MWVIDTSVGGLKEVVEESDPCVWPLNGGVWSHSLYKPRLRSTNWSIQSFVILQCKQSVSKQTLTLQGQVSFLTHHNKNILTNNHVHLVFIFFHHFNFNPVSLWLWKTVARFLVIYSSANVWMWLCFLCKSTWQTLEVRDLKLNIEASLLITSSVVYYVGRTFTRNQTFKSLNNQCNTSQITSDNRTSQISIFNCVAAPVY